MFIYDLAAIPNLFGLRNFFPDWRTPSRGFHRLSQFQEKPFSADSFNAGSIKSLRATRVDKFSRELRDTVESFESAKAVTAARNNDMQTVGEIFSRPVAVKRRRYRIPFSSGNQYGRVRTNRRGIVL